MSFKRREEGGGGAFQVVGGKERGDNEVPRQGGHLRKTNL